jgi:hypothetical protein
MDSRGRLSPHLYPLCPLLGLHYFYIHYFYIHYFCIYAFAT